jgi:hypothetical protein
VKKLLLNTQYHSSAGVLKSSWNFFSFVYSAQLYYKKCIPRHCVITICHSNWIAESVIRNVSPRSLPASSLCPYADTFLSKTIFTLKLKITLAAIDNKDYCICAWSFASVSLGVAVSAWILCVQSGTRAAYMQQYRKNLVPELFSLRSSATLRCSVRNTRINWFCVSPFGMRTIVMTQMWCSIIGTCSVILHQLFLSCFLIISVVSV